MFNTIMFKKKSPANTLQKYYNSGMKNAKDLIKLKVASRATVYRFLKKVRQGIHGKRRNKPGPKGKLNTNDQRCICQLANKHPYWPTYKVANMAFKKGTPRVSKCTVWRLLKKRGFKNLLPRKVPFLTPAMKEKRLQWFLKNRSR